MVLELGKKMGFTLKDKTIGEVRQYEKKLGPNILDATLGVEGLIKNDSNLMERQIVLSWIEKFKATRFANLLVSTYVNTDDVQTKHRIEKILSRWLENGDIKRLPKRLVEGTNRKNKKKDKYMQLLISLAPYSISAFASALLEMTTKNNVEKENLIYLYKTFKKIIETKSNEKIVIRGRIDNHIYSMTSELVLAKLNLDDKSIYTEENSLKRTQLETTYIKATIFSDLLQFAELKDKHKSPLFFLIDKLMEIRHFKPAVNIILNARLGINEKIQHIHAIYTYLNDLEKKSSVWQEDIKELKKTINSFLREQNIVLFIPGK